MATDTLNAVTPAQQKLGGIGRTKLYRLIASGELKSVTIGRRRFIPDSAISEYIERLKSTA